MSYLEKLLQGQAVEWVTLGEVANIKTGQAISKSQILDNVGIYPVINSGREPLGYINTWNTENDPIGITTRGAGVGSVIWQEGKYFRGNLNYSVTVDSSTVLPRFLYHILLEFQAQIHNLCTFTGIPALNAKELKKLKIPLPPLTVQQRIAQILDTMTALTAELTAEHTLRQKQYQYYREKLLSFADETSGGGYKWVTLGEVAVKITSGGTPRTGVVDYYGGDIPWLRTQEINFGEIWDTGVKITEKGLQNSSAKWIPKNCVIIAMYGATVGKVGINKIPMTTNQPCANVELDSNIVDYKYVFYYLSSKYEYIKSLGAGSQTNINAGIVKKIKIPLPPLATQQNIVAILDKFDTLTQSISEGLPHAIALHQKRYEYYRGALLNFNE